MQHYVTIEVPADRDIADLARAAKALRCDVRVTDQGTIRLVPTSPAPADSEPVRDWHFIDVPTRQRKQA
jgi:hypothetical protein